MPLLLQKYPDRPPFRVVELPAAPPSDTEAALVNARRNAGARQPPLVERPTGKSDRH
jgi:CelD/BcsL family acetyltransferase involved in cellulose biosynthesis